MKDRENIGDVSKPLHREKKPGSRASVGEIRSSFYGELKEMIGKHKQISQTLGTGFPVEGTERDEGRFQSLQPALLGQHSEISSLPLAAS